MNTLLQHHTVATIAIISMVVALLSTLWHHCKHQPVGIISHLATGITSWSIVAATVLGALGGGTAAPLHLAYAVLACICALYAYWYVSQVSKRTPATLLIILVIELLLVYRLFRT
jgi:hypothetical protein